MFVKRLKTSLAFLAEDVPRISAKTGLNIDQVMEQIVKQIPPPHGDPDQPLQALIFDSYYDAYKGVIVYVRIKEGQVHTGDVIRMMATGATFTVVECGYMRAGGGTEPSDVLSAGEVGYIAASIKICSGCSCRRYHYLTQSSGSRTFARLQDRSTNGVQRHLSRRWRPLF